MDEDCSRLFGLRIEVNFLSQISSGRLCSRGGGKVWLLQGFGGSPPRFQEVNRLGMVSLSSRRCRQALGASLLSCCVRRWVSLPRWRVVCLSTKVVVLEFSLARVGCVSSLTGGRLCRFSDRLYWPLHIGLSLRDFRIC